VQRSKEAELRRSLREIRDAIDAYKAAFDEGRIPKTPQDTGYPKNLRMLVEGVEDARSPTKTKIYFLRRIPADPITATDGDTDAEKSWGKRAYASEPDEPKEGVDIFDVYSTSSATGLNGVPYAKW
jgi:general secretion pathway protein G